MSEKYSAAPNFSAMAVSGGAKIADQEGGDRAGEERADRRDGERRARPALPRHLVAVDGGHGRGGLARHVDEDRGGRAAILRAVVDAGQHDQRRHRIAELEGDRQEHGDGRRGADARQHADQRAEQHADQAEEQVRGASRPWRSRGRGCETGPSRDPQSGSQGPKRAERQAERVAEDGDRKERHAARQDERHAGPHPWRGEGGAGARSGRSTGRSRGRAPSGRRGSAPAG